MRIPPARVYFPAEDMQEILSKIEEVLQSGYLTLGKHTEAFEEAFARYVGAKHAVAVCSGTAALEIALRILDVRGKEVVVPTNTFFATAAAVVHAGGTPRFADIDTQTFALSKAGFEAALSDRTAGAIIVHIGGIVSPWTGELRSMCDERGLFLLEDAAHAHGSRHEGKAAGTFGHAGAFSFYPTKVMTTGEGGIIVTDDENVHLQAKGYRDQGKTDFASNFHTAMGYAWRMSEMHAVLGEAQLRRLDEFIAVRSAAAIVYDERLPEVPGITAVPVPDGGRTGYYKYMALLDRGIDRAALKQALREEYGVGLSGEVYDTPCHRQPVFAEYASGAFPVADDICGRHVCLPLFNNMTSAEAGIVVDSLERALPALPKRA